MSRAFLSLLALAALGCLAGCRTTVRESPAGLDLAQPIVLEAQRAWRVVEGERVVGLVVRFGAADAPDDVTRHYYSVRNALQQELGAIDGHGRAWRFEPHRPRPLYLGSGTVSDGARAVLSLEAAVALVEAQLSADSR